MTINHWRIWLHGAATGSAPDWLANVICEYQSIHINHTQMQNCARWCKNPLNPFTLFTLFKRTHNSIYIHRFVRSFIHESQCKVSSTLNNVPTLQGWILIVRESIWHFLVIVDEVFTFLQHYPNEKKTIKGSILNWKTITEGWLMWAHLLWNGAIHFV